MVQKINLSSADLKLPRRLRGLLIGPSGAGKTQFMKQILRFQNEMLVEPYTKYVYCSPNLEETFLTHEHKLMNEMRELAAPATVEFYPALPTLEQIYGFVDSEQSRVLLLLDDFNEDLFNSKALAQVFTRLSSHYAVDALCTSHTGFSKGRYYGDIYKQANLIVIWRCLSDRLLLVNLSKKMFPGQSQFICQVFDTIVEQLGPYGYMAIYLSHGNPLDHKFSLKSRIFPFINRFGEWEHSPLYYKSKAIL